MKGKKQRTAQNYLRRFERRAQLKNEIVSDLTDAMNPVGEKCESPVSNPEVVYTAEELRILQEHHRRVPFSAEELRRLKEIKKIFNARIAPQ